MDLTDASAIDTGTSEAAIAVRAAARILSRLRAASARLAGDWEAVRDIDNPKWIGYPL